VERRWNGKPAQAVIMSARVFLVTRPSLYRNYPHHIMYGLDYIKHVPAFVKTLVTEKASPEVLPTVLRNAEDALWRRGVHPTLIRPSEIQHINGDVLVILDWLPLGRAWIDRTFVKCGELVQQEFGRLLRDAKAAKKQHRISHLVLFGITFSQERALVDEHVFDNFDMVYCAGGPTLGFADAIVRMLEKQLLPRSRFICPNGDSIGMYTMHGPSIDGYVSIGIGCWRACSFCSSGGGFGGITSRPISEIADEASLHARHGKTRVVLKSPDMFNYERTGGPINRRALYSMFDALDNVQGLRHYAPQFMSAVDIAMNPDVLCRMTARQGLYDWQMLSAVGLETGSVRIIKKYMKAKTGTLRAEDWPDIVKRCLQITSSIELPMVCYWIYGFPDETSEDHLETVKLMQSIRDLPSIFTLSAYQTKNNQRPVMLPPELHEAEIAHNAHWVPKLAPKMIRLRHMPARVSRALLKFGSTLYL